jgi:hypothetical protein
MAEKNILPFFMRATSQARENPRPGMGHVSWPDPQQAHPTAIRPAQGRQDFVSITNNNAPKSTP